MLKASLDIKSAFDEARPRHIARILEGHNIHRWLIAPSYVKVQDLKWNRCSNVSKSSVTFNPCLREGSVEALRLWQMMAAQILASVESGHRKNMGLLLDRKGERGASDMQLHVGGQLLNYVFTPREVWKQMLRDLIEAAEK